MDLIVLVPNHCLPLTLEINAILFFIVIPNLIQIQSVTES